MQIKVCQQTTSRPRHLAVHDRFRNLLSDPSPHRVDVGVHRSLYELHVVVAGVVHRVAVVVDESRGRRVGLQSNNPAAPISGTLLPSFVFSVHIALLLLLAREPAEEIRVEVRRLHVHERFHHALRLPPMSVKRPSRRRHHRGSQRGKPPEQLTGASRNASRDCIQR